MDQQVNSDSLSMRAWDANPHVKASAEVRDGGDRKGPYGPWEGIGIAQTMRNFVSKSYDGETTKEAVLTSVHVCRVSIPSPVCGHTCKYIYIQIYNVLLLSVITTGRGSLKSQWDVTSSLLDCHHLW